MFQKEVHRTDLVTQYMQTLRKLMRLGVGWMNTVADALGVNSTDLMAISYLRDAGPMAAGELAKAAGLTTGAMTAAIDRLERAGFVKREADLHDRRKTIIRSEKFPVKLLAMRKAAIKKIRVIFSRYSDAELLRMIESTRDIMIALEKEIPNFKKALPKKKNNRKK
jgi:DNA-binding MarR family transcriptional regulator